jgi:YesN/AraC family two-component response regulator
VKLFIKYMVTKRCQTAVKEVLKNLGLHYVIVDLGEVDIMEDLSPELMEQLRVGLQSAGFELLDDRRTILIEKVKTIIIEMVQSSDEPLKTNFSDYLCEKLNYDYTYLANLFSQVQGTTIQQFIILLKIERIKELIVDDELSITEIAFMLNYSSVSHLSNQFKKTTGFTPSQFKNLRSRERTPIEDVGNKENV